METSVFRRKIKKKYTTGTPGKVVNADYFYYDTAPGDAKGLAIVCGGYEKCAPDFDINRNTYPYFFIKYTLSGEGTLEINSQTLPLRSGILTGFEPGTAHHYKSDPNNPMEHIFVTFIGNQAANLFRKSTLATKHFIEVANQDKTLDLFNQILQAGHEKPSFSQEICCAYLQILLLEQSSSSIQPITSSAISMETYQKCKKYIDTHFSSVKSPGNVADKCGIDVRYMSTLFKKHCYIPPGQYLTRLKFNKAANLLLTTGLTVKEIAFQVGFEDPYHFSKNFKKFHGYSPRLYRIKHMERTAAQIR
ncbi:MAG: AraC family transcriptional regulator [Planctomycetota bacterium]